MNFFDKKITVCFLDKDRIVVADILKSAKKIDNKIEVKTKDGYKNAIQKITENFSSKKIRIVLADSVSYVLKIELPHNSNGTSERDAVSKIVKENIPEELHNAEWDFAEFGITKNGKKIIAFAPVKKVYDEVFDVLQEMNISVEAVEPEVITVLRNEDPLIGMALKEDLKGADEKVLNLIYLDK